jgi:CRISPR-associated protein Cmr3
MINPADYRWLRIEPVDAWFFRDGRPSNYGEDQSDLESEFPPNAPTVVGATRAAIARGRGWNGQGSWHNDLHEVLGNGPEDLGSLRFLGPFLGRHVPQEPGIELLWPLPRHVVGRFQAGRFLPVTLLEPSTTPVCCDAAASGIRLPAIPAQAHAGTDRLTSPEGIYVTSDGLRNILAGRAPAPEHCVATRELFVHESRVGILRNADRRTTEGGALYNPRYVRLRKGVSLVQAVAGLPDNWAIPALTPLGGESRMATLTQLTTLVLPSPDHAPGSVVIALSPVAFPAERWWGASPGEPAAGLSAGWNATVAAVATDRPRLIGGWNTLNGAPQSLRAHAPAGTVWWLDAPAHPLAGLALIGDRTSAGFGLVAAGAQ